MHRLGIAMLGLVVACGHARASRAPLTAARDAEPATASAASSTTAPAKAKPTPSDDAKSTAAKQGRRALYRRSCELGSALGCNELAILLGPTDPESLGFLERACTLGLPRGCANFGLELWRAARTDQEKSRAEELLTKACDAEDAMGCTELGNVVYARSEQAGESVLGRAHAAYEKGCKLGGVDACVAEGWMFWSAQAVPRDVDRAKELFRGACEHENFGGCAALGYALLDQAKNPGEFAEGQRFLSLGCEHSEPFGCFVLGMSLQAGDEQAKRKGRDYLERACKLGQQNACRVGKVLEERARNPAGPASPSPSSKNDTAKDSKDDDEDEDNE